MSVYGVQLQIGADAKICIAQASVRVHAEKLTLYGVGLINYAGHHTALTLQQLERGGNAIFARLDPGETGTAYRGVLALLIDHIVYGVGKLRGGPSVQNNLTCAETKFFVQPVAAGFGVYYAGKQVQIVKTEHLGLCTSGLNGGVSVFLRAPSGFYIAFFSRAYHILQIVCGHIHVIGRAV